MLINVKRRETKKYVKLEEGGFSDIISAGKICTVCKVSNVK